MLRPRLLDQPDCLFRLLSRRHQRAGRPKFAAVVECARQLSQGRRFLRRLELGNRQRSTHRRIAWSQPVEVRRRTDHFMLVARDRSLQSINRASRAFSAQRRRLQKSGGNVKLFRQRWAVSAAAVALTVVATSGTVSNEALSDTEPPAPLRRGDAGAPATLAQCGDCHMIFPARMLPSRSWTAILSRMDDHFGENAAIPEKDLQEIRVFLTSNAADSPNASPRDRHFMSEILPGATPLRITRTPWWNQMHADFDFDGVKRSSVKSAANCLACHKETSR